MKMIPALLLQDDSAATGLAIAGASSVMLLFFLAIAVVFIIGLWKVFTKAGQPGWAVLVPIYNIITLLKIAGRPAWWVILYLIPFVNFVVAILVAIDVAKAFGQSTGWGIVMLFLLSGIGYLVLGFGNYQYIGTGGGQAAVATA